ncbi:MAG: glycosyltransferase [Candidatus Ancaeobacter aquaticus]|nr:glycosyltransferase [Candidatus Ancaeobacter aquaticus]
MFHFLKNNKNALKIAIIYNKDRDDTIGYYFEKALRQSGHTVKHFWTEYAQKIKPEYDFYLRIDHGDYKYDIPKHLRPCAFLAIDTHLKHPYEKIREQSHHYDFVFCAQKEGAEKLARHEKIDTFWVPLGCDPVIHKKLDCKKNLDIGFVGTDGKKCLRKMLLEKLKTRYPNSFIGWAEHTKMSKIYSSSKIGFNYSIKNDINMRMFEVMSCGTLLITNAIDNNGFNELFEDKKNIIIYNTPEELFDLIDYYLSHDTEREKIALAGHKLAVGKYTYRDRMNTMLSIAQNGLIEKYKKLIL